MRESLRRRTRCLLLPLLAFAAGTAHAQVWVAASNGNVPAGAFPAALDGGAYQFTVSGQFVANAPNTAVTAPNAPVSYTFTLPTPFTPVNTSVDRFDINNVQVSYTFNGATTQFTTTVAFYRGLIGLFTTPQVAMELSSQQWTGTSTAPTILPGTHGSTQTSLINGTLTITQSGPPIYVCRTTYQGRARAGKVRPGGLGCRFEDNGTRVVATSYEVLTSFNGSYVAVAPGSGTVPPNSLSVGLTFNQQNYACLASYQGLGVPGQQVQAGGGPVCYFEFGDVGRSSTSYSMLTGPPLSISCNPSTGPTTAGVPFSSTCTITGGSPGPGTGLATTYAFAGSGFPAWLNLVLTGPNTATASGTPTAGAYNFKVSPQDLIGQYLDRGITFAGNVLPACTYSFPFNPATSIITWGAAGDTGSILLQTQAGCPWTATSNAPWLTLNTPSGTGQSQVVFTAPPNNTASTRTGTVVIAGTTINVAQGSNCSFSINPTSASVSASASATQTNVTVNTGCAWTATSNSNFLTVTSGANGSGNGTVSIAVQANTSQSQRSGTVTIAGQTFTVNQAGLSCTYTVTNTSMTPSANGDSGTSQITAPAGCAWTANSNVPWVTVNPPNGSGNGSVTYTVQANPTTSQRVGTAMVAGQPVTFTQAGAACNFSLSTSTGVAPTAGGVVQTMLTASNQSCQWAVVNNSSFLSGPTSGTGSQTLTFTAQANNTNQQRNANINIAGLDFAVVQGGSGGPTCTFTVSPGSANAAATGGNVSFFVTASDASCSWTTSGLPFWLTGNGSGTGSGTAMFFAAANTGAARNATITVAGQSVSVTQAEQPGGTQNCTFTIVPSLATIGNTGGSQPVRINASDPSCTWSVTNSNSFVTPNVTNGVGSGPVYLILPPNPGGQRVANVSVAGQNFALTQSGAGIGSPTAGLYFVRFGPCRLMETRPEYNIDNLTGPFGPPFLASGSIRTLTLSQSKCQVPANAKGFVINVTAIARGPVDTVTVWPAGEQQPTFRTVSTPDGQVVANTAFVKAGPGGAINVYANGDTDMVLDISGYFTDDRNVSNLVFYPLTPCRVLETRPEFRSQGGAFGPPSLLVSQTRRLPFPSNPFCPVPSGAAAYSFNLTVVPPAGLPYVTVWPSDRGQPLVSSINSFIGRTLTNNVIVPAATADGSIDVYANAASHILMDINGYFAPEGSAANGLKYYPVDQCRITDTPNLLLNATFGGPPYANETARTIPMLATNCNGIAANARAYAVNVTALPNGNPMPFLTMYPAPPTPDPTGALRPGASVLNAFEGQTVSNSAIVPAGSNGAVNLYAYRQTQVMLEVSGYFAP